MFEITSETFAEARTVLARYSDEIPDVWAKLLTESEEDGVDDRPFVQLGYDEMSGDEIDRLLGFAGIPEANSPIGLDLAFQPIAVGGANEFLIFPLDGLENHLKAEAADLVSALEQAGSMDAFADARGDDMTAREYLIGGVTECIRYCRQKNQALTIRW